jgi:hypothetical protein
LVFRYQPKGALPQPWQTGPISFGSEPGGSRGVWTFGREQSHIDFEFDDPFPGPAWNVALRPDPSDAEMQFSLRTAFFVPPGPPMKFKFVTYVGFAKGKGAVNTADFGVATLLTKALGPGLA